QSDDAVLLVDAHVIYDGRLLKWACEWDKSSVLVDSKPEGIRHERIRVQDKVFAGLARVDKEQFIQALKDAAEPVLVAEQVATAQGLEAVDVETLPRYNLAIRRALRPYWIEVRDLEDQKTARWIMAKSVSKGHMEWWVYLINRPAETFISYFLAETPITPNQVTIMCNLVAFGATALFVLGHWWWALGMAVAVGILDGLDGRQARVQIKTSKLGELEHLFDKVYEVSWMIAIGWFLSNGFSQQIFIWWTAGWIAAHFIDNGTYSLYRAKRGIILDEASPIDAAIRFVASNRNTNVAFFLIGMALGRPLETFYVVVLWNAATALIHWLRVAVLLLRPATDHVKA
ncbi:MAG: CDP-alcohol phosphatidyltransferase family protein, partial [Deltaproteobacteria bacterium]|nr:CDP-alcohol phosphatidyltransferase family protein [Deltaproteobacteria bacterium]